MAYSNGFRGEEGVKWSGDDGCFVMKCIRLAAKLAFLLCSKKIWNF